MSRAIIRNIILLAFISLAGIIATQLFWVKKAIDLKPSEAALIAAVLPNPRKWSPRYPDSYILKKKNRILNLMYFKYICH